MVLWASFDAEGCCDLIARISIGPPGARRARELEELYYNDFGAEGGQALTAMAGDGGTLVYSVVDVDCSKHPGCEGTTRLRERLAGSAAGGVS